MTAKEITPIERSCLLSNGGKPDRLPCVPIVGNTAARVIGVKVSEFRRNGKLLAKAHIESYRAFGYDGIRIFTDLYTQAEAMGARVRVPQDETAYLDLPAISSPAQIDSLRPADPYADGCLPEQLEAMKITVNECGSEVSVAGALTCPFTNASFLVGTESLVRLMYKDPDTVRRLCELSLETNLRYAEAIIKTGCTPSLTDAMSSSTVISPKQFQEFSFPYLKRLAEYIHSRGKAVTLHICGKTKPIWEAMTEAGADCISIDNDADLSEARSKVGDRVKLMGNVKPSEIMLSGTPRDVRRAVIECVTKAHDNPRGYIVASGCSLPTETPFENIHAMLDTVREIGYPVNKERLAEL